MSEFELKLSKDEKKMLADALVLYQEKVVNELTEAVQSKTQSLTFAVAKVTAVTNLLTKVTTATSSLDYWRDR